MQNRSRKAFTLIELIIVIVVLGILATIAIVGYRTLIDRTNRSSVETSARNFDSLLRGVAAFGSADYTINGAKGDVTDTDPRKSVYLLELLEKNSIPDQQVPTDSLGGGSLRVLVYNGSTGGWTRLACDDVGTDLPLCLQNPGGYDNAANTHIGDDATAKLPGPYSSTINTGEFNCIQFHKSGQDIFMGWPDAHGAGGVEPSSSTKASISTDIDEVCYTGDGTAAGTNGLTPIEDGDGDGAVDYYELAGALETDSSWGN